MMKVCLSILFCIEMFFSPQICEAQAGPPKYNLSLTFNASYNVHTGKKSDEAFPYPPSPSAPGKYTSSRYRNTPGGNFEIAVRRNFSEKLSLQPGISATYNYEQSVHNDSNVNRNGSRLEFTDTYNWSLDYSMYLFYRIRKFNLGAGIRYSFIQYSSVSNKIYEDGTKDNMRKDWEPGNQVFLCPRFQYQPGSDKRISINVGAYISHYLFTKNRTGYYLLFNLGVDFLLGKKV
jgi:hypothetical protein